MKKILVFIILAIATLSCNKEETNSNDPTKLAKVIFHPGQTYEIHWDFYKNGLLKEITKADGTILEDFVYDANGNLLTNTIYNDIPEIHTFTYDSNNLITSVNGKAFNYDNSENAYIKYSFIGDENYTYKYYLNSEGLLTHEEYQMTYPDGSESGQGYGCSFLNGNLTGYNIGPSVGNYEYDTKTNPFKQALLPIVRAFFLTGYESSSSSWCIGEYSSINNVTSNEYDIGPESVTYEYIFNSNHLPISRIRNHYYHDVFEGSTTANLYYYQGDVIP